MKAEELRIGNYIISHSITMYEVLGINDFKHGIGARNLETSEIFGVSPDTSYGIPLTEEWLLKLGFERHKDVRYFYDKDLLTVSVETGPHNPKGCVYFNSWRILKKKPEYVHQLQNLYFALTGEELKIK